MADYSEEAELLLKILKEKVYKDSENPIDKIYNDLSHLTDFLDAYGETKEKAVENYIRYKYNIVINYYTRRGLKLGKWKNQLNI